MSRIKTLFPLLVPSSLPAFDGTNKSGKLKYYFKPSSINTIKQIDHLQISIVMLDTNRSILDLNTYPYDFIFDKNIKFDEKKGYYYIEIPVSIFPSIDRGYKIQVRAVEPSTDMPALNSPDMGVWMKNNQNKISEWSTVTIVLPITPPLVEIQGLNESEVNAIDSSGYNFVGIYEPKDPNKSETLSSYRFSIYYYDDFNNRDEWKLYSTSGERNIGIYEKPNLSFVFDKDLLQGANYVVVLSIKTKNLYTENKIYKIEAAYPILEMYNTINAKADSEEAKMDITINAKQIILKPIGVADVEYIFDQPGWESYPYIRGTHAVIKGVISENKNFFLINLDGQSVIQTRVKIDKIYDTIKEASKNPFIEIGYNPFDENYSYYTKFKFMAFKENLSYPLYINGAVQEQTPEWKYSIIVRKEICTKVDSVEKVMLIQDSKFNSPLIANSAKEFYIYLKENQGLMNLTVQNTY